MDPDSGTRRTIYLGRKIDLALQDVRLSDGSVGSREVVLHPGAVVLVPMVDDDHVCLIENHRYAVGKTLIELPAGTLDPGETPAQTAARELEEETGYVAGRIEPVTQWFVSPGVMDEIMYLYVCHDLRTGTMAHQPDERLVPRVVPWSEAMAMTRDGRIEDAKSLLGLLLVDRLRARS